MRGGGEYQDFPWKIFCLTVPKSFVGQFFTVAIISGIEKVWIRGGGGIKIFRRKFFCLTVPKNFVGEPFCAVFQKNSGSEKFMDKRGGEFQDFQSKIFCLTVPKNSVGEAFAVAIISGIEKIWIRVGGVSRFSVENFLSHSAEKVPSGTF